jgi:hypothetical protein
VTDGLGGIQQDKGLMFVSDAGERPDVLNSAGDVGGVGEHNQPCGSPLQGMPQIVGVEETGVGVEGQVLHGDAAGALEVLERTQHGIVIEF